MNEETPPSNDRTDRKELLWDNRIEHLIKEWSVKSIKKSNVHNSKAKYKKKLYYGFNIPCIVIPFFMSISSIFWGECSTEHKMINSIIACIIGSLNGIQTLLNLGSQYQLHFEAESKYRDLHIDIESVLIKHKQDRLPADIFLERCRLLFENIERNSPDI